MVRLKSRYLLFEVLYPEQLNLSQDYQKKSNPKKKPTIAYNKPQTLAEKVSAVAAAVTVGKAKVAGTPGSSLSNTIVPTPPPPPLLLNANANANSSDGINIEYSRPEITAAIQLRQPSISLDSKKLLQLVRTTIDINFGIKGSGDVKSTLAVKYFSPRTSTGILRVGRDHVRTVWAALSYVTKINNKNVIIRVVRVSGTIKKCEQAAILRDKKVIDMIQHGFTDNKNLFNQRPKTASSLQNQNFLTNEQDDNEDESDDDNIIDDDID